MSKADIIKATASAILATRPKPRDEESEIREEGIRIGVEMMRDNLLELREYCDHEWVMCEQKMCTSDLHNMHCNKCGAHHWRINP